MARKQEQIIEDTQPDPFVARANEYAGVVEKNLRLIVAAVGGLLVVGVVGSIISSQSARSAAEETAKLTKAVTAYEEAVDPKTATSTTGADPKLTDALAKAEALASGQGAVAQLAKLYSADLARRTKDESKAQAQLRSYLDKAPEGDPLRFFAIESLGQSFEDAGKLDEALAEYVKLGQVDAGAFGDLALKHQARVKEAKGDKDGAKSLYRALLDKYAESKFRDLAEQRLSSLE